MNCSRPKPCNSSPPDFSAFSNHSSTTSRSPLVTRLSDSRPSSYYQHPALRGCHPFSLELAINRNLNSRLAESNQYNNRQNISGKSSSDSAANSDVEMTMDIVDDRDREIDLSLKPDSNHTRSSSVDEEKISPSPEHDNSFESSESVEPLKG